MRGDKQAAPAMADLAREWLIGKDCRYKSETFLPGDVESLTTLLERVAAAPEAAEQFDEAHAKETMDSLMAARRAAPAGEREPSGETLPSFSDFLQWWRDNYGAHDQAGTVPVSLVSIAAQKAWQMGWSAAQSVHPPPAGAGEGLREALGKARYRYTDCDDSVKSQASSPREAFEVVFSIEDWERVGAALRSAPPVAEGEK